MAPIDGVAVCTDSMQCAGVHQPDAREAAQSLVHGSEREQHAAEESEEDFDPFASVGFDFDESEQEVQPHR